MGYEVYSGIFGDEMCIRFMLALRDHMLTSFGKVWSACAEKHTARVLFAQCMSKVPVWGDDVFRDERSALVLAHSNIEEMSRATFVAYARNVHQPTGMVRARIRMTVPPLLTVLRSFLIAASKMSMVTNGDVFSARPIDVKDMCMECLRTTLANLQDEHVYVERGEPETTTTSEQSIEPWESISNVSASSKSSKSSKSTMPSHKTVSVATKGVFAEHLSKELHDKKKTASSNSEVSGKGSRSPKSDKASKKGSHVSSAKSKP